MQSDFCLFANRQEVCVPTTLWLPCEKIQQSDRVVVSSDPCEWVGQSFCGRVWNVCGACPPRRVGRPLWDNACPRLSQVAPHSPNLPQPALNPTSVTSRAYPSKHHHTRTTLEIKVATSEHALSYSNHFPYHGRSRRSWHISEHTLSSTPVPRSQSAVGAAHALSLRLRHPTDRGCEQ